MRATLERSAGVQQITCVVGGWTEPRGSRPFFGGLLLGVYDEQRELRYVGHAAAGFNDADIGRIWTRLHALKTRVPPFSPPPRTRERAHWVKPSLAVRIKFSGWTSDRKLRHPTYAGLSDAGLNHEAHEGT
jgi:bifunctional non-homologous end joining protein LigD